jgi:hypothetical protein
MFGFLLVIHSPLGGGGARKQDGSNLRQQNYYANKNKLAFLVFSFLVLQTDKIFTEFSRTPSPKQSATSYWQSIFNVSLHYPTTWILVYFAPFLLEGTSSPRLEFRTSVANSDSIVVQVKIVAVHDIPVHHSQLSCHSMLFHRHIREKVRLNETKESNSGSADRHVLWRPMKTESWKKLQTYRTQRLRSTKTKPIWIFCRSNMLVL